MEHIEVMLQGAIVERDDLHKVLDEHKLRCEMGHGYQAEVLMLKTINRTFGGHKKPFIIKPICALKHYGK